MPETHPRITAVVEAVRKLQEGLSGQRLLTRTNVVNHLSATQSISTGTAAKRLTEALADGFLDEIDPRSGYRVDLPRTGGNYDIPALYIDDPGRGKHQSFEDSYALTTTPDDRGFGMGNVVFIATPEHTDALAAHFTAIGKIQEEEELSVIAAERAAKEAEAAGIDPEAADLVTRLRNIGLDVSFNPTRKRDGVVVSVFASSGKIAPFKELMLHGLETAETLAAGPEAYEQLIGLHDHLGTVVGNRLAASGPPYAVGQILRIKNTATSNMREVPAEFEAAVTKIEAARHLTPWMITIEPLKDFPGPRITRFACGNDGRSPYILSARREEAPPSPETSILEPLTAFFKPGRVYWHPSEGLFLVSDVGTAPAEFEYHAETLGVASGWRRCVTPNDIFEGFGHYSTTDSHGWTKVDKDFKGSAGDDTASTVLGTIFGDGVEDQETAAALLGRWEQHILSPGRRSDPDIEALRDMVESADHNGSTTYEGVNPEADRTIRQATAYTLVEILGVMKSIDSKMGRS